MAEYLLKYPDTKWDNGTLIYLGVKNEHSLRKWEWKLQQMGIKTAKFIEPDLNNQATALAAVSSNGEFKHLRLLDF